MYPCVMNLDFRSIFLGLLVYAGRYPITPLIQGVRIRGSVRYSLAGAVAQDAVVQYVKYLRELTSRLIPGGELRPNAGQVHAV